MLPTPPEAQLMNGLLPLFYRQLVNRARGRLECDRESAGIDDPSEGD